MKVKLQVSNLALLDTDRHVPLCSTCWNGHCQMMYSLSGHKLALGFSTSPVSNHPLPGHVRVRLKDLLELDSRFMRMRCNQASPRGLRRTAGVWPFPSWQGLLKTQAGFFFLKDEYRKAKSIPKEYQRYFLSESPLKQKIVTVLALYLTHISNSL